MKVLFITFSDIEVCSSSNIRNVSLIKGLIDTGNTVDIISYKTKNSQVLKDLSFQPIINQCRIINLTGEVITEKVSSTLLSGKKSKIKKTIYNLAKKIYYSFQTIDSYYKFAKTISIDGLELGKYDIMISSSNPYSVHILARRIYEKYFNKDIDWIQYWGDPLYYDNLTRHPFFPSRLKRAEKKLMEPCDSIVYTNGVILQLQKNLFPSLAKKMSFIETPYAFVREEDVEITYQVGYFGSFSTTVRDIRSLYHVLRNEEYSSVIIGNGDIELHSENNLTVLPRMTVEEVSNFENRTRILICLCNKFSAKNKENGLIPGKVYHYGSTDKEILIIGATPKVREFLSQYDRFKFVDNNEKSIKKVILDILQKPQQKQHPLIQTLPVSAAKHILASLRNVYDKN